MPLQWGDDVPIRGSFVVEDENNGFEGHFIFGERKYEFLGPTPEWGTSVTDIKPWSTIPKHMYITCRKLFMGKDGKLYKSYQHTNHFNVKKWEKQGFQMRQQYQV